MKTKQLAYVLIKILGLSVVVHGVPAFVTGIYNMTQTTGFGPRPGFWVYTLSSLILLGIGIYLMVKSHDVVEFLFKGEEE
jgi:multisubunit Na+/H+ antiporter MnhC subunit